MDTPEFKVEIATSSEAGYSGEENCSKNSKKQHDSYILFNNLQVGDLGPYSDVDLFMYIKYMGSRTVRVTVYSEDRTQFEHATGFICKRNGEVYVVTNSHVINSELKAENCTIDFNYEDEGGTNTITTRGTKLRHVNPKRDYCQIEFDTGPVRHITDAILDLWNYNVWVRFPGTREEEKYYILKMDDGFVLQTTSLLNHEELPEQPIEVRFNDNSVSQITEIYKRTPDYDYVKFSPVPLWLISFHQAVLPVLNINGDKAISVISISHPHGLPKKVSIGEQLDEGDNGYDLYHSATTCFGSSGSPVFRIGIKDIGKFPRTMLYTHYEGAALHEYNHKSIISGNYNKATLNTRRPNRKP
ncbi:hypothetical protein SNE40_001086 [Patella caerulea]|uniref:Serine protease n=1 Tax=Patella caerulea TaxID=87958 RepID=A0AAN8Q2I4_PATCE